MIRRNDQGERAASWNELESGFELDADRKYAVTAIERVYYRHRLLGHVSRTFYRNEELEIDPDQFWCEFDENPAKFTTLRQAELFTESEANLVIALIKRVFPDLRRITKTIRHHDQLTEEAPLRLYTNDGRYSQLDLSDHYQELGFPIGAFADSDIWAVMEGEPLLTIALPPRLFDRCVLCEGPLEKTFLTGLMWLLCTKDLHPVCGNCAQSHAPELVDRLQLAELAVADDK